MTDSEYISWLDYHFDLFPQTANWMANLDDRPKGVIQATWRDILRNVALQDARKATLAMVAGDEPKAESYEHNMTAAKIKQAVKRFRDARPTAKAECDLTERPPSEFPAGRLFADIRKRIDSGQSSKDASAEVIAEWEKENPTDETKEPRFHCVLCRDSEAGLVTVVRAFNYREAKVILDGGPILTASLACSCRQGQEKNKRRREEIRTYNPADYVWRDPRASREKICAKLEEFVREKCDKRNKSIVEYNESIF